MTRAEAAAARTAGYEIVVGSRRRVPYSPAVVYALLSDLTRHWPLLGGDLIEAGIVDGSGAESAELLLRGPLPGISRRVVTRVTYASENSAFGGEAVAGSTRAAIDWKLEPDGGGATAVSFDVGIDPGSLRDRLLVQAARPWLARRCALVLSRLERELEEDGAR